MPGLGRTISHTCNGEKEKCEVGGGVSYHANISEPACACYKCNRIICLVTIKYSLPGWFFVYY